MTDKKKGVCFSIGETKKKFGCRYITHGVYVNVRNFDDKKKFRFSHHSMFLSLLLLFSTNTAAIFIE